MIGDVVVQGFEFPAGAQFWAWLLLTMKGVFAARVDVGFAAHGHIDIRHRCRPIGSHL